MKISARRTDWRLPNGMILKILDKGEQTMASWFAMDNMRQQNSVGCANAASWDDALRGFKAAFPEHAQDVWVKTTDVTTWTEDKADGGLDRLEVTASRRAASNYDHCWNAARYRKGPAWQTAQGYETTREAAIMAGRKAFETLASSFGA